MYKVPSTKYGSALGLDSAVNRSEVPSRMCQFTQTAPFCLKVLFRTLYFVHGTWYKH